MFESFKWGSLIMINVPLARAGGLLALLLMSIFMLPTLYVWMASEHDKLPDPEAHFAD
jgi:Cu/Ag efflux pump CusA